MGKTKNEVVVQGYIKTRITQLEEGRPFTQAFLSTTPRRKLENGKWVDAEDPQWHTLIPVTQAAVESLRKLTTFFARARGTFRRRQYQDENGKTRYANEIVVFTAVEAADPERINNVEVHGFLARAPHIAYPADGGPAVLELAVATESSRRDPAADSGWTQETTWHRCYCRASEDLIATLQRNLEGKKFVRIKGELLYRTARKRDENQRVAEIRMTSIDDIPIPVIDIQPAAAPAVATETDTPEAKFQKLAQEKFRSAVQQPLPLPTANTPVVIIPL